MNILPKAIHQPCGKTISIVAFWVVVLLWTPTISSQTAFTAPQVLSKAIAAISGSKGCEANFNVFNSGYSGSGRIVASGKKFHVSLPDASVWYNGSDLYTYNSHSGETTVVVPTSEELSQANPLAYVTGAQESYNVSFSTVKKEGRYVLELIPKKKGGEVKRITLTLKKSDFTPEKIVVEPTSGNPISADISSFKTGISPQPNEFEYPKSKFPKAEIIDLR
ncbi:MAG: outer-membrane lipoprotein carrier protein LolA [Muribaculaceae bacterium]|nr:outer-membrane lipoprotein carrier protein LolA [Muribaculaceae bacterium]